MSEAPARAEAMTHALLLDELFELAALGEAESFAPAVSQEEFAE